MNGSHGWTRFPLTRSSGPAAGSEEAVEDHPQVRLDAPSGLQESVARALVVDRRRHPTSRSRSSQSTTVPFSAPIGSRRPVDRGRGGRQAGTTRLARRRRRDPSAERASSPAPRAAGDREAAALRERGGLQAETETTEILGGALLAWAAAAQPHRRAQAVLVHAPPVVGDRHPRVPSGPVHPDLDQTSAGRDAVVDEVRDRGGGRVPERAHRLDHRGGVRARRSRASIDFEAISGDRGGQPGRRVASSMSTGSYRHRRSTEVPRTCVDRCRVRAAARRRSDRRRGRRVNSAFISSLASRSSAEQLVFEHDRRAVGVQVETAEQRRLVEGVEVLEDLKTILGLDIDLLQDVGAQTNDALAAAPASQSRCQRPRCPAELGRESFDRRRLGSNATRSRARMPWTCWIILTMVMRATSRQTTIVDKPPLCRWLDGWTAWRQNCGRRPPLRNSHESVLRPNGVYAAGNAHE